MPRRLSREWVVEKASSNSKGQRSIFMTQRLDEEWTMFCDAIDEVCRITTDPEVPVEKLAEWIKKRCWSRKTRDDWGAVPALHRDFTAWSGEKFTVKAFQRAVEQAGFAVHRNMISKLFLREGHEDLQVRPQLRLASQPAADQQQRGRVRPARMLIP